MTTNLNPMRGIFLMISAITLFSVMGAFVKATPRVPAGEAMFFRSLFALPVVVLWLLWRRDLPRGLATKSIRPHVVRGVVGSLAMALGFAGLRYLPLPEVTAIRFVTPVLMVVLAAVLLGERLRLVRISAVLVGLIGVLIITWPRLSGGFGSREAMGALIVLCSAMAAALAQVFVKAMSATESTAAITFWFQVTAMGVALLSLPFGWVMPTAPEAALLVAIGLIGGLGQILVTASYRFAEAGVLAPFTYVSMLWSLVLGYVWFAETPTWPMMSGAGLIIGASVLIVLRERQLGLRRTAERKVEVKGLQ